MLLRDWYEQVAALVESDLAANTRAAYDRAWRLRVEPSLGDVLVGELSPVRVRTAMLDWSGAPSTRQDAKALLSRLCDFAVMEGLLPSNPVRAGRARREISADDPASRALTDSEVSALLGEAFKRHPRAARLLSALVHTGCRLGEANGLMPEDIDGDLLRIRRSVSPRAGRMEPGPTKGRATRAVPILVEFRPVLAAALDDLRGPYLFSGANGGAWSSRNLSRALDFGSWRDSIRAFPENEPPLRFHDLRHTAAMRFFAMGLSAPEVQRILGHSSLQVTSLYSRATDNAALRAVELSEAS